LGVGAAAQNPKPPIPNPQSPIPNILLIIKKNKKFKLILFKNKIYLNIQKLYNIKHKIKK